MQILDILKIVISIASALLCTLIPTIVLFIKKCKAAKNAKTQAEKEAVYNEMLQLVNKFVQDAEDTWRDVNDTLKSQGKDGCGKQKKSSVMDKLQIYCLQKGLTFDSDYWSQKVDDLVTLTRQVNADGLEKKATEEKQADVAANAAVNPTTPVVTMN